MVVSTYVSMSSSSRCLVLSDEFINLARPGDSQGYSSVSLCVSAPQNILSGVVGGSWSNRGTYGVREENGVSTVLIKAIIRPSRYAQDDGLDGVSGMIFASVAYIISRCRRTRERYDPYCGSQ